MFRNMSYLLATLVITAGTAAADVSPEQKPEVEHLLEFVRTSECIFIRNDDEHSGADAWKHIRRKYEHFVDEIDSTERFIDLAASRSTLSGERYSVRCPGQEMQTSQEWLLEELAGFRNSQTARASD